MHLTVVDAITKTCSFSPIYTISRTVLVKTRVHIEYSEHLSELVCKTTTPNLILHLHITAGICVYHARPMHVRCHHCYGI